MKRCALILSLLMFFAGGCASAFSPSHSLLSDPLGIDRAIDDYYFPDDVKTGESTPPLISTIQ